MKPLLAAALVLVPLSAAAQEDPDVQRGRTLAQTWCAKCHAIGPVGESPLKIAPPFRDLHRNYPVEQLEEPLAEGIVTGHPSMPQFAFEPHEVDAFIAYLKSLEP